MGDRVSTNGALPLGDVRARAATALAPMQEGDPDVHPAFVDGLDPPALLLMWDTPWVEPRSFTSGQTMGRGYYQANLQVLMIAGRLEPGPGVETLEGLLAYVIGRLQSDNYRWPQPTSTPPRRWTVGQLDYLGATVNYQVPVTF
jgi:hypothetical protein